MGDLAGKITTSDLQRLANNPNATRVLDNKSGHINIFQEINGKIIRITVPRDEMKIISFGRMRDNQVDNLIKNGRYTPIK